MEGGRGVSRSWPGSLASRPRSAVAMALTRAITVPEPAWPRLTPCCERMPAIVRDAISNPLTDVLGWFQMLAMEFIRDAPCTEKGQQMLAGVKFRLVGRLAGAWASTAPQEIRCDAQTLLFEENVVV